MVLLFLTCIRNLNLDHQQSFNPIHSDGSEGLFSELFSKEKHFWNLENVLKTPKILKALFPTQQ